MKRHVIIGCFGRRDRPSITLGTDETATRLEFINSNKELNFGIGQAINYLNKLNVFPNEIGLDLLVLASHVYAADTRISRASESQDNWTREIRLVVPVSDSDRWNAAVPILVRMLNFLTGDRWKIAFRARPKKFLTMVPRVPNQLLKPSFDSLALFSGGLDSLIGAINMLEDGKTPLFVSHASDGATSKAQENLYGDLKSQYQQAFNRLRLWMTFPKDIIKRSGAETSTRGRSFLFFATGIFAATGLNSPFILQAPENGLIALNVPLDPLRLGALSTRTTHPFYMARWNELLAELAINGKVENPYWNKTKGEMIAHCSNPQLLQSLVAKSLSCSSPTKGRWRHIGVQHCGECLPCLIRRAAILFGIETDTTIYTVSDPKGPQVRSFKFAIERLQREPTAAKLLIHKPGPLSDDPSKWEELAGIYGRGLNEVAAFLTNVAPGPR